MLSPNNKFHSPEVFDLVGNLIHLGIWRYNVDKDFLEWDDVMFEIYGLKQDSFRNKFIDWRETVHPEDVEAAEASFQESIKRKGEFTYTFRIIRKDSHIRFIKANARIVEINKEGERIIVGANQDVTDILSIKEDREELLQTLEQAQKVARVGSWQFYPKTNTSVLDDVTKSIYGLPPEYEIDASEGITYYKEGYSRDTIIKAFNDLLRHGKSYDLELELVNAQGRLIWVRTKGKAIVNAKGEVIKAVGIFQDITEQIERQKALEESNRRFQGAFDSSAIGMTLVSLKGNLLQVNKSLCDFLGYSEKELLKKDFQELTHPEDLSKDLAQVQACIEGRIEFYQMDKRYIHASGHHVWAFLSVAVIRDEEGDPLYFIYQVENINDRKKYEQDLLQANKNLQNLTNRLSLQNKSLNDFAHITSHNLRAPVANLKLLGELYRSAEDDAQKDEVFGMVQQSTDDLLATLDNLVDSLVVRNKPGMGMKDVKLTKIIQSVLKNMNELIRSTNATVNLDLGPETLFVHPHYLESILANLMSNAIKYKHPDRNPEISLSTSKENAYIIMKVSDNGLGINLKRHGRKVFGLQKTFHKNSDSKGVGLFMVKTHMEAMGGEVSINSEPNEGTTFTLKFKAP